MEHFTVIFGFIATVNTILYTGNAELIIFSYKPLLNASMTRGASDSFLPEVPVDHLMYLSALRTGGLCGEENPG